MTSPPPSSPSLLPSRRPLCHGREYADRSRAAPATARSHRPRSHYGGRLAARRKRDPSAVFRRRTRRRRHGASSSRSRANREQPQPLPPGGPSDAARRANTEWRSPTPGAPGMSARGGVVVARASCALFALILAYALRPTSVPMTRRKQRISTSRDYAAVRGLIAELLATALKTTMPAIFRETVEAVTRLSGEDGVSLAKLRKSPASESAAPRHCYAARRRISSRTRRRGGGDPHD